MISQTTSYAIYALSRLEGPNGNFSLVREVAKDAKIPPDFLAKIFNTLRRKGLVVARRGVGGGVRLNADPHEITLLDVCTAMDDPILESRCMLGLSQCNDQAPCTSHNFWNETKPRILEQMRTTLLSNVHKVLVDKGYLEPKKQQTGN